MTLQKGIGWKSNDGFLLKNPIDTIDNVLSIF